MTLTTTIAYHPSQDNDSIQDEVNKLRDAIRCFATNISDSAFYDAKSAGAENCIVVWANSNNPEMGMQIKCDDIDNIVTQWCKDIADTLKDLSSQDDHGNYYEIKISDVAEGGPHIACSDDDEYQPFVLWIIPVKGSAV